ncbi:MAG: AAA family ATPase [Chloroflexota bacterium]
MNRRYIADYITRALSADKIEEPDRARAGEHYETLATIHHAHTDNGSQAATAAWGAIKRLAPELAMLESTENDLIHADELGTIPIPMYLLTSYPVYSVGFNVLIGESGVGKSFIALDIAGRIATKAAVVYIAGEGLAGYAARWYAWKDYHHITDTTYLFFYKKALQVLDKVELETFIALIATHEPSLVIIDTLARSAVGVDENSAKEMGEFISACDHIRNSLNVAVLVVHHTGKNGDIRGSSSLYGAADSLMLARHDDGFIRLINANDRKGKNKYSEAFPDKTFTIAGHNGSGPDGTMYEGAVLKSIDLVNIGEGGTLPESQQNMLKFIGSFGADGIDTKGIIAGTELAQSTVYRNLGKFVADGLLEKHSGIYSITDTGKTCI